MTNFMPEGRGAYADMLDYLGATGPGANPEYNPVVAAEGILKAVLAAHEEKAIRPPLEPDMVAKLGQLSSEFDPLGSTTVSTSGSKLLNRLPS